MGGCGSHRAGSGGDFGSVAGEAGTVTYSLVERRARKAEGLVGQQGERLAAALEQNRRLLGALGNAKSRLRSFTQGRD